MLGFLGRYWPVWVVVAFIAFSLYIPCNAFNPESRFCRYRIYKQPDGSYQVWWECITKTPELSCATYTEAKAFQERQCRRMKAIEDGRPVGERVP